MLPIIAGYAATWNEPTTDWVDRGHTLIFERGAFLASIARRYPHPVLRGHGVAAVLNHNLKIPIAGQDDGSLELFEDSIGLFFRLRPWDTPAGQLAVRGVREGYYGGASVYTAHMKGVTGTLGDGVKFDRYREAGLVEVSLVRRGANPRTTVALWG